MKTPAQVVDEASREELGYGARYVVETYLKRNPNEYLNEFVKTHRCRECGNVTLGLAELIGLFKIQHKTIMGEGIIKYRNYHNNGNKVGK